jgi:hypothetical protein
MPEYDDTILQNYAFRPLAPLLALKPGPWALGDTNYYCGAWSIGEEWRKGYIRSLNPDYKRFDSTIMRDLVSMAVTLCRLCFDHGLEEQYDAYWTYIIDSAVQALIVFPDGSVRITNHGMKSGHEWTSILESIANALMIYTWLHHELTCGGMSDEVADGWLCEFYVKALGDYSTTWIPEALSAYAGALTLERFKCYIKQSFHIDVGDDKSTVGAIMDLEHHVNEPSAPFTCACAYHFLGKYVRAGRGWRPWNETYALLLYPEYTPTTLSQALAQAYGHYLDCGNEYAEEVLYDYCLWLLECGAEWGASIPLPWRDANVSYAISSARGLDMLMPCRLAFGRR